ncbi:uncharacterized protein LOC141856526 isoform X2 [Brevipalpus obovatus]|uniref:uncharacterized protein LOC141856526 isoform X2 n=1 Tax=Brevipalpus obovatus TaxID=246614 RepID=UPI003D9E3671
MDDKFTIHQFTTMNEWYNQGLTREGLLRLYQAIEDINLRPSTSSSQSPHLPPERITATIEERGSTPESFNDSDNGTNSAGGGCGSNSNSIPVDAGPSNVFNLSSSPSLDEEVERFKSLEEDKVMREIIRFIKEKQIKQKKIAEMCNISQPYVSRFLNQDGPLSENLRTTIYLWYFKVRRDPSLLQSCPAGRITSSVQANNSSKLVRKPPDIVNSFHPVQERVLSEVFDKCQPLKDSERATIRAVHNWFITRRRGHKNRNLSQKSNLNLESNESSLSLYHDAYNSSMDLGSYNNLIDPEQDEQDSSQNFEESFAVKME